MSQPATNSKNTERIAAYKDVNHAEDLEGILTSNDGYKYRLLEGRVMPPYVTPERYQLAREIDLRSDDISYCSYPKSGSTWLAYILTLITNNGTHPPEGTLRSHLHWLESSWTYPHSREELDALPAPRIFKSHMPATMALGGEPTESAGKYLYIARNPKDVAVSYYYFERQKAWSGNYDGSWEHWLEMFIAGEAQRGDWFDHVLSWWERHDAPNVFFLKYEDLLRDFQDQLINIATFLEYELSNEILIKIQQRTAFDQMKNTKFSNMHEIENFEGFFRKGKVGSWQDEFTTEQETRFNDIINSRLSGTGLDFSYV